MGKEPSPFKNHSEEPYMYRIKFYYKQSSGGARSVNLHEWSALINH